MLAPLIEGLKRRGWIGPGTLVAEELPVNGRRVDFACMSKSGRLSAFELKLGDYGRVIEQAAYNALSFDRSWAVVDRRPPSARVDLAERMGLGIMVICADSSIEVVLRPVTSADLAMRRRMAMRIRSWGRTSEL